MAFGVLQSTVQAAVPRYRLAQIPKSVSSLFLVFICHAAGFKLLMSALAPWQVDNI